MQTRLATLRPGDPVDGVYLVTSARILTSSPSAKWKGADEWRGLTMTVTDGVTTVKAFLGKVQGNADLMQFYGTWKTVRIVGKGKQGQDGTEIAADDIRYEAADPDLLTPKALRSAQDYETAVNSWIDGLPSTLHAIVTDVFRDVRDRFFRIPAAERKHHAVLNGLAQHTVEVTTLAASMADSWNALGRAVDRDLCIAGALCHDIGKVDEYDGDGYPVTVGAGGLHGHVITGAMRVYNAADSYTDTDLRDQLFHIVLSHHGTKEWGSPVTPATPEAFVVHTADMLSAWVQAFHEATPAHGELWAKSPICGFVWKGDRYGIEVPADVVEAAEKQLALFDAPIPAPAPPSPFRPPAMAPVAVAGDDLDDPFRSN